jgi:hypothetical protein
MVSDLLLAGVPLWAAILMAVAAFALGTWFKHSIEYRFFRRREAMKLAAELQPVIRGLPKLMVDLKARNQRGDFDQVGDYMLRLVTSAAMLPRPVAAKLLKVSKELHQLLQECTTGDRARVDLGPLAKKLAEASAALGKI